MTLKVNSTRFGELSVEEDRILKVTGGILGFSDNRFILLDPAKGPFWWLQSVDTPDLAFVVVDPRNSVPEYVVRLNSDEYRRLGLDESSEVVVLSLVTMHLNPLEITMNLLGPLVVNPGNLTAIQVVMEGFGYSTRFPYFRNAAADGNPDPDREKRKAGEIVEKLRAV